MQVEPKQFEFCQDVVTKIVEEFANDRTSVFDLSRLRLISIYFRNAVDDNASRFYSAEALQCKIACVKFTEYCKLFDSMNKLNNLRLITETDFKVAAKDYLEANETYQNHKLTYHFYSIFTDTKVIFNEIPQLDESFNEAKCCLRFFDPTYFFAGIDPTEGPFVLGKYTLSRRDQNDQLIAFLFSKNIYIQENLSTQSTLTYSLPSCRRLYVLMNNLFKNGAAYMQGAFYKWEGYDKWQQRSTNKLFSII